MIQPYRPLVRALLVSVSTLALFVAGCHKKVVAPPTPPPPPPSAAKPTASLSADRTSINKGQSVRLSWTTTDANNVSIAPEVGAVTPQGSTTVNPSESTTYTLTASGGGGTADASVHILRLLLLRRKPSRNSSSKKYATPTSTTTRLIFVPMPASLFRNPPTS
jgi:hypothetical protein